MMMKEFFGCFFGSLFRCFSSFCKFITRISDVNVFFNFGSEGKACFASSRRIFLPVIGASCVNTLDDVVLVTGEYV